MTDSFLTDANCEAIYVGGDIIEVGRLIYRPGEARPFAFLTAQSGPSDLLRAELIPGEIKPMKLVASIGIEDCSERSEMFGRFSNDATRFAATIRNVFASMYPDRYVTAKPLLGGPSDEPVVISIDVWVERKIP